MRMHDNAIAQVEVRLTAQATHQKRHEEQMAAQTRRLAKLERRHEHLHRRLPEGYASAAGSATSDYCPMEKRAERCAPCVLSIPAG